MRKFNLLWLAACLAVGSMSLSSCSGSDNDEAEDVIEKEVTTPKTTIKNIQLNGTVLTWDIEGETPDCYVLNGKGDDVNEYFEVEVQEKKFDISKYPEYADKWFHFQIGPTNKNSQEVRHNYDWHTNFMCYTKDKKKVDAPTDISIKVEGNKAMISLKESANATSYHVFAEIENEKHYVSVGATLVKGADGVYTFEDISMSEFTSMRIFARNEDAGLLHSDMVEVSVK